jgi:hypothetical protein
MVKKHLFFFMLLLGGFKMKNKMFFFKFSLSFKCEVSCFSSLFFFYNVPVIILNIFQVHLDYR